MLPAAPEEIARDLETAGHDPGPCRPPRPEARGGNLEAIDHRHLAADVGVDPDAGMIGDGEHARLGPAGEESRAIGEAKVVGRADVEGPPLSRVACGPNSTPLRLSRKKFALGIAELESISPSMSDRCPPVTRPMMLAIDPDPVKVALSPVCTLNWPKL